MNNPPNSASAVEVMTLRIMLNSACIGPFYEGTVEMVSFLVSGRGKIPPCSDVRIWFGQVGVIRVKYRIMLLLLYSVTVEDPAEAGRREVGIHPSGCGKGGDGI